MLVDFIGNYYSYKLCDSSKKQVSMQSFLILSFSTCNTKAVFEMVDGFLNIYTYFVSAVPFCTMRYWVEISIDSFM